MNLKTVVGIMVSLLFLGEFAVAKEAQYGEAIAFTNEGHSLLIVYPDFKQANI